MTAIAVRAGPPSFGVGNGDGAVPEEEGQLCEGSDRAGWRRFCFSSGT